MFRSKRVKSYKTKHLCKIAAPTNINKISDKITESKIQKKVCKFYNTELCKHRGAYKYLHPIEKCEISCSKLSCPKIHPKPCRYGEKCREKDICDCKHKTSSTEDDLKAEMESLNNFKVKVRILKTSKCIQNLILTPY